MMILLYHLAAEHVAGGLFSIADHLDRAGIACRIVHVDQEQRLCAEFDPVAYARECGATAVGFSLQWAHQTARTLECARELKGALQEVHLFMGGLTASVFAEELLAGYPWIDSVVLGDGEEPTLRLALELKTAARGLHGVPNLVHRTPEGIVRNAARFVVGDDEVRFLRYDRFDLMRNGDAYRRTPTRLVSQFIPGPVHYQPAGKGCPFECTYCGGSAQAQRFTSNRTRVVWRPRQDVFEEMKEAYSAGLRSFFFCFDPDPGGSYYSALFEQVRESLPGPIGCGFSCWKLPSLALQDALSQTFAASYVELSPEVGDEEIRLATKGSGAYFTNRELEDTLESLAKRKIGAEVYFSYFHSPDPEREIVSTFECIERLTGRFGLGVLPLYLALSTDPAATKMRQPPDGLQVLYTDIGSFGVASGHAGCRFNLMGYRPLALGDGEFDHTCLAVEAFTLLHTTLPVLSRALYLAEGAAGILARLRNAAGAACREAGAHTRALVPATLKLALDTTEAQFGPAWTGLTSLCRMLVALDGGRKDAPHETDALEEARFRQAGDLPLIELTAKLLASVNAPERFGLADLDNAPLGAPLLVLRTRSQFILVQYTPPLRRVLDTLAAGVPLAKIIGASPPRHKDSLINFASLLHQAGILQTV